MSPPATSLTSFTFGRARSKLRVGAGKTLLQLVMAELRGQGHARLLLGCSSDPTSRCHGFYRHLGWTSTGETDQHGDDVLEFRFTA